MIATFRLTVLGPRLAIGVLALALTLRAPGIAEWWLNPDEGIYFSVVTRESFSAFWAEAMATAHPPLYFLALRAIRSLTDDFVWLRAVALLSGSAAVCAFVFLGRETSGPSPRRGWLGGLLAGLILAVSPRAIVLSQVIRPYMLLILVLAGSWYFLLRHLREPRSATLVGHLLCSTIAVTLHYSAVLALEVLAVLLVSDGARRGFRRPEWRRSMAAQAVPWTTVAVLYVAHLRAFMQTAEASDTIDCCLGAYMARTAPDAWHGFVGFHSLLAGESLAVSASLLTMAVVAYAVRRRAWQPALATLSAFAIALAASYLQIHPFGPTRHSAWLFVFVVPTLAWGLATAFLAGARTRAACLLLLATLVLGSGPLSAVLDSDQRPRDISERVLRSGYMPAMAEVLDPATAPKVVFMSTETFRVLIPLFWRERLSAVVSEDGLYASFTWGTRHVVVMPGRDFTSLPRHVGRPDHLLTTIRAAEEQLGLDVRDGDEVLVLAAGYESQGMAGMVELAQTHEGLGTTTSVPGFIALELDPLAYARALDPSGA